MNSVSLIMCTARKNPRYPEMCNSIVTAAKVAGLNLDHPHFECVFVDEQMWYNPEERRREVAEYVAGRFYYQLLAPKPTVWRGPNRLTNNDYWDKSNASNTGIVVANNEYLVFIDDSTIVDRNWFVNVRQAMLMGVPFAGGYKYLKPGAKISDTGQILEGIVDSDDYRLRKYTYTQPCTEPGEQFGGNMGLPAELAFRLEGYDEIMSGSGGLEDSEFSVRVNRLSPVFFFPGSIIYQLMEEHEPISGFVSGSMASAQGGVPKSGTKLFPYRAPDGVIHQFTYNHLPIWWLTGHDRAQNSDGTWRSEYNKDLAVHRNRYWSIGNLHSLKSLRKYYKQTGRWLNRDHGFSTKDWRDGQLLETM